MEKRPSKFSLLVIVAFLISTVFLFFWQFHWSTAILKFGGETIEVFVAKTPRQWYKGVGGRKSLEPQDGMLFVFGNMDRHGIVMRDTLFPLDIVWFDHGVVVDMAKNVPTEIGVPEGDLKAYYPRVEANMVLELPAGFLERKGVKIGDALEVVME